MTECVANTQRGWRGHAARPPSSGSSTVVDSSDVVHRYEHVLSQLSKQALEQQAEIQLLRTELQRHANLLPPAQRSPTAGAVAVPQQHQQHRHHQPRKQEYLQTSAHQHRRRRTHAVVQDTSAFKSASSPVSDISITLSPPSSPHLSSIAVEDATEVCSVESPQLTRSAAGTPHPTPLTAHAVATPTKKNINVRSNHNINESSAAISDVSGGLSPTPPAHDARNARHHSAPSSPQNSSATTEQGSVRVLTFTDLSSHQYHTSESIFETRTLQQQQQQQDQHTPASTPLLYASEAGMDGDTALSYLISVFSSIKKLDKEGSMEERTHAAPRAARQLFQNTEGDLASCISSEASAVEEAKEKEGEEEAGYRQVTSIIANTGKRRRAGHGNACAGAARTVDSPTVGRHTHASLKERDAHPGMSAATTTTTAATPVSSASSWQDRYARIVAAAAEESGTSRVTDITSPLSTRHRIAFSSDQSASDLVGELIHFFTI